MVNTPHTHSSNKVSDTVVRKLQKQQIILVTLVMKPKVYIVVLSNSNYVLGALFSSVWVLVSLSSVY